MPLQHLYKIRKILFLPVWTGSIFFILAIIVLPSSVLAQNTQVEKSAAQTGIDAIEAANKALEEVQKNIALSQERVQELSDEVDKIKKDQETLSKALVQSAQAQRTAADNIAQSQIRMNKLIEQKNDTRQKLAQKNTEFAKVIAVLQRMGLKPPPALLIRPDDALISIRSAVLLGAVTPRMRASTMQLTNILKELSSVQKAITQEQDQLVQEQIKLAEEQNRLQLLLEAKQKLQETSVAKLEEQKNIVKNLSEKATTLEELVNELNKIQSPDTPSHDIPPDYQLTSEVRFSLLRGKLKRPVTGKVVRGFGVDGIQGETIETTPNAIVTAPADATVAFADNFRSYGRIVIFDVGDDYKILIAGMEHLDVSIGQFVLAGEPIGTMGSQLIASATALDIGKSAPMLYIEFRQGKEGKPIDPAPWWAARTLGRDSNDS